MNLSDTLLAKSFQAMLSVCLRMLFDATQRTMAMEMEDEVLRYRLYLGMTAKTLTLARWLEQSNSSLN